MATTQLHTTQLLLCQLAAYSSEPVVPADRLIPLMERIIAIGELKRFDTRFILGALLHRAKRDREALD